MRQFFRFYLRSFFICLTLFAVAFVLLKFTVNSVYRSQGIYRRNGEWVLPNDSGPLDKLLVDVFIR